MKKHLTIGCLVLSGLIILATFGVGNTLLVFLVTGTVPLVNYEVSPAGMMLLISLIFVALMTYLYSGATSKFTDNSATQHQLPKRRFRNI